MSDAAEPPTAEAPTPLWRQRKVVSLLAIALLAELAYGVLNISAMPVYLKYDRGFPEGTIGLIIVAFLLSEAVFKTPMGALADRFGRKRLIVIGPIITIFTALATLAVPHDIGDLEPVIFFGLRALDGIAVAMLWPAAFALVGETVRDDQKQEAMSMLNMCYLVGLALALPIGGLVNDLIGPSLADFTGRRSPSLYLAALICLGVSIAAYAILPSGREIRQKVQRAKRDRSSPSAEFRKVLATARSIPGYMFVGGLTFMGIGFPLAIVKIFAEDQFKMSETQFGMLVFPAVIAMALLAVPMGRFGERIGRHKAVHVGLAMCGAGMAFISIGAIAPAMRTWYVFAIGGVPIGIGFLLTIPAWYASVSELSEERRASNIGAVMTAQGLGAIVGTFLGSQAYQRLQGISHFAGIPVDRSFGLYSPFVGCAICVIAGWAFSIRILRSR
ncbi:MAG: MFS transporter [Armatimonadetes bacterium]|nr:MFS transporter [Armatimonadota bacterium]